MLSGDGFVAWISASMDRLGIDEVYAPYLSSLCEEDTAQAVDDFLASIHLGWNDDDEREVRGRR